MYAIIINAVAVVAGSAIGALFRRSISEKYINVLNTAMGLCALVLGSKVAMENMQKSTIIRESAAKVSMPRSKEI